jgi:hypothetical protein
MLTVVIGHISWHEVKKFAITTVWPLRDARVNVLPELSTSGSFTIFAGIGALRNEPPPGAAFPWPTASGVGVGIFMLACAMDSEENTTAEISERAILVEPFMIELLITLVRVRDYRIEAISVSDLGSSAGLSDIRRVRIPR